MGSSELVRTLLPLGLFVVMALLAYVKVAIVLQVFRRGIGGGVPPLLVTVFLGLTLATLTMSPVMRKSLSAVSTAPESSSVSELWRAGVAPLEQFLSSHTRPVDLAQV